jgi:type I restriction enzyme, S subunit
MGKGFQMVPLGNVLRQRSDFIEIDDFKAYKRCRVQLHAQGIVLRDMVQGTEMKTKKQQVCHAGEFLVAEIDAKVGGFGIVHDDLDGAIVSSHYFLFDLDAAVLNRRFLEFFVRTPAFMEQVKAQGTTNYAAIRPGDVLGYKIPLPPLSEQRRIIARIEELAARIEEARGLRREAVEEAEALTATAMNAIFNSNKSDTWLAVNLGEVADIQSGVTLGRMLNGPTIILPYLRVANVQDGHLDLSTIKEIEILANEFEKWQLKPGDILLTEGGDWDKLGRGTVWHGEIPDCIHQNHIFRIRSNPKDFDPNFLVALISSPYGKSYFREASKQTTNLASINQKQLKAFKIFQPPLLRQQRIAAYLDDLKSEVNALKQLQAETSAELGALLPSILDKAFKGEL